MGNWICKRCETANGDGAMTCEVCNSPWLYTKEEVEQLISQRVAVARAEVLAAVKAPPPPPPAPAPVVVAASSCDGVWFLVAFLVFMLVVFMFG